MECLGDRQKNIIQEIMTGAGVTGITTGGVIARTMASVIAMDMAGADIKDHHTHNLNQGCYTLCMHPFYWFILLIGNDFANKPLICI